MDVTEAATVTVGRRIGRPLPGVTTPLHQLTAAEHPAAAAALDAMRDALDRLAALAPDRLAMLLAGTLDVFAYRLDAWITSLATRRLAELRATSATGVVVGGFGWLEDVRPRAPRPEVPPPPDEQGPLLVDPLSAGFVHAPSLAHAATAALLRSGYVAAGPTADGQTVQSPFAVDLSSQRVRLADWLLDGVRQGQELGALLGQRFERGLHDHGLDRYIAVFRRVAPFGELAVAQAAAADAAAELARLRAGNPDLAAATAALAAAQTAHAALVQEQAGLPGRVARAQAAIADLDRQRTDVSRRIQQLQNLMRHAGENPDLEEQLTAAAERRNELNGQVGGRQAALAAALQRQGEIDAQVNTAAQAVVVAQQRVDAATGPASGLDDAIARDAQARAELERILDEHRRRRLYPPTATIEALEVVEAVHVVDGLALATLHAEGHVPFGTKGLPAFGSTDHGLLLAELAGLGAALDAVADALTAESVHQLVQGNPQRAGASLDAVVKRTVAPPELEFARTPRTGTAITHRVLALAPATAVAWPTDARQVRATVEPALDRWAGALLGDPRQIRCDVRYLDGAGELLHVRDLRMASAALGALDVLALVDGAGAARPELLAHLADHTLVTRPAEVPADARVELVLDRDVDWPGGLRSFAEVFEVARAANELLATARPLGPRDLAPAGSGAGAVDLADLAAHADALDRRVGVAHAALTRAVSDGDAAALRSSLVQMLYIGVAASVPAVSVGDDEVALAELRERVAGVASDVGRRLDAVRALDATAPDPGAAGRRRP